MNEKQLLHEYINSILEANKLTEEVTYRTVDFNKLLEIDPGLEYELESRSESNDYRLIYKRFLRSKTGKLRLDYNQLDLIACIYEDDSKHDQICEILYGSSVNEMVYSDDVTPFELSNNPVKFTVYGDSNNRSEYDFNNLKELFKYVSDCGGFNSFTGLRWYISSNYKDGEFYYIRDRFSKGGWRWEDCNGNPVQGTEYRKSRELSEDEVSDKYNIFQQIKVINPNAKYSNYKNKSVNEMLAILQSYRDSQNKSKKQKVSPKADISKKQIGLVHLNNNNFEVLFSDGTSEKMNYETAKSRGYLDYQDLNDKDREEYDLNHMNESTNLTEATITDIINDSKSSDPRRIALAKSLYTEYKGVDSDGTLLFETDSQTRSGLGHKQFIFYPGFFDMLDKVDQNEAITEEDVLNILTGDLSLKCTCFTPEMEVSTFKGKKKIKNIEPEDLVLTHDGTYKKVLNIYEREADEDIYIINGIEVTGDHRIAVYRDNKITYILAKDLKIGDKLIKPKAKKCVGYIYDSINNINDKHYIGSHKFNKYDSSYYGSGKLLKLAINKYGIENFNNKPLEVIYSTKQDLMNKETDYIQRYINSDKICYNISPTSFGGDVLSRLTQEEREIHNKKMSLIAKGTVYINKDGIEKRVKQDKISEYIGLGYKIGRLPEYVEVFKTLQKPHSKETRQKISKSLKGKAKPACHSLKVSKALKGRPSPIKGKHLSDDHKRKISESKKGKFSMKNKSEEDIQKWKNNISNSMKQVVKESGRDMRTFLGKHHSEESKKLMSQKAKERWIKRKESQNG